MLIIDYMCWVSRRSRVQERQRVDGSDCGRPHLSFIVTRILHVWRGSCNQRGRHIFLSGGTNRLRCRQSNSRIGKDAGFEPLYSRIWGTYPTNLFTAGTRPPSPTSEARDLYCLALKTDDRAADAGLPKCANAGLMTFGCTVWFFLHSQFCQSKKKYAQWCLQ